MMRGEPQDCIRSIDSGAKATPERRQGLVATPPGPQFAQFAERAVPLLGGPPPTTDQEPSQRRNERPRSAEGARQRKSALQPVGGALEVVQFAGDFVAVAVALGHQAEAALFETGYF